MIHMTTESTSHAADIEAIDQLVATVEHSQQNKDPEEFLSLFHPDAIWTTAHGKVLIGLDAIAEFTRKVLPAASWDGKVTYEVVHVLFIRPDVAAVKVRPLPGPGRGERGRPAVRDLEASRRPLAADRLSEHGGRRRLACLSITFGARSRGLPRWRCRGRRNGACRSGCPPPCAASTD